MAEIMTIAVNDFHMDYFKFGHGEKRSLKNTQYMRWQKIPQQ
ncbi:hypothetical protein [Butyrivibrio sp. YAB3001]|nr:hypothetical protein [Butyrivibrio sp. YAB3001]SFC47600.1 hypothetical protein SAMN02910398_02336 [Butyrivibrio sp. YAB3001]